MSSIIRTSPNPEPTAADCDEKDSCDNGGGKGSPDNDAHSTAHDDANSDDKDMSAASVDDKADKNTTEIDKDNEQKVVDDDHAASECVSPNPEQCKDNDDNVDSDEKQGRNKSGVINSSSCCSLTFLNHMNVDLD